MRVDIFTIGVFDLFMFNLQFHLEFEFSQKGSKAPKSNGLF